jgi:hypothetical protein
LLLETGRGLRRIATGEVLEPSHDLRAEAR